MLTKILVPKPKKAFQSLGTHSVGFCIVAVAISRSVPPESRLEV
jgi:hypothetical protein